MKALGSMVREYMDVDEQGVQVDGEGDLGLVTYFDVDHGMCRALVVVRARVLHRVTHPIPACLS
jgi:hypothetical protein